MFLAAVLKKFKGGFMIAFAFSKNGVFAILKYYPFTDSELKQLSDIIALRLKNN